MIAIKTIIFIVCSLAAFPLLTWSHSAKGRITKKVCVSAYFICMLLCPLLGADLAWWLLVD